MKHFNYYSQYIQEGLLNTSTFEHKLSDWTSNKSNVLFICGLSASGKTTLSDKLSKKHNAEHVPLDIYYLDSDNDQLDKSLTINKLWMSFVDSDKSLKKEYFIEDDYRIDWGMAEKYKLPMENLFKLYYDYRLKYVINDSKNKYIVEGLQLSWYKDSYSILKKYPVIILGTGLIVASIRAAKRDKFFDNQSNWLNSVYYNFINNYKYVDKYISRLKKYLST